MRKDDFFQTRQVAERVHRTRDLVANQNNLGDAASRVVGIYAEPFVNFFAGDEPICAGTPVVAIGVRVKLGECHRVFEGIALAKNFSRKTEKSEGSGGQEALEEEHFHFEK